MTDKKRFWQKGYDDAKKAIEKSLNEGWEADPVELRKLISYLLDLTEDDIEVGEISKELRLAGIKGSARAYEDFLDDYEDNQRKEEQEKKEANRKTNPCYYIANGGGGDCFDYAGYDTNTHEIKTAFVDWDSGHGNEMLPDWEDNDIKQIPESCIADFKKTAVKWIADQCGTYFFCDFKGNMSVPCKVITGRKFRGSGTLVKMTSKVWIERYGRKDVSYTAHIIDENGNEQTAVGTRCEFLPGTIEKIVTKAVERMDVNEIQSIFYSMLWHFGKYRSDCYPKILAKAFEELNTKED